MDKARAICGDLSAAGQKLWSFTATQRKRQAAMLQGWVVIVVALGYIGLLFVVASYGDRMRGARHAARGR